jgi:hypothetical protein
MAGLLDPNYTPDPLAMGLLSGGAALLTPRALGGGVGPALMGFSQGAQQAAMMRRQMAQDAERAALLRERTGMEREEFGFRRQQFETQQRDAQARQARIGEVRQRIATEKPDLLPLFDMNPDEAMKRLFPAQPKIGDVSPKDYTPESIAQFMQTNDPSKLVAARKMENMGGVARNPYNIPEGTPINDPNALMHVGPGGALITNDPLLRAKQSIAKSGATNIGLPKIEVKMGDSVGGQVGPMLKDSATAVGGAVKMADAADRILNAVEKGGVIAGPTASLRLKGAQVASMLGIGGKDAVAQTRQVIRGLAESSVEARKELAGQGQVTENEAKAVDKALSGNIDDLTVEEIRDIARLNLRHASSRARQHQQYLSSMPESMAPARPFYTVPGMDRLLTMDPARFEIRQPPPASVQSDGRTVQGTIGRPGQPSVDDLLRKYGGR